MLIEPLNDLDCSPFTPLSERTAAHIQTDRVQLHSAFWLNRNTAQPFYLFVTAQYLALSPRPHLAYPHADDYYTPIHFDLKFQTLYESAKHGSTQHFAKPIGFKLVRANAQPLSFTIIDSQLIGCWLELLSKRLNQLGFHQMFKPVRKLGKGGFATVYEVERVSDNRKFAVKAFSKLTTINSPNPTHRLTFLNQIKMMRTANHANLIKLDCVYQSDNSLYLVLEQLDGGQLHTKINHRMGKFTPKQTKRLIKGLALGLQELHSHNIMHRDIKPQNIMLRNEDSMEPVIVDFGLSADTTTDDYLFYRCGTPGYVAPQVITLNKGQKIAPLCDIFSVGAIFHILLMAKPLFPGSKFQQVYEHNKQMNFNLRSQQYSHLDPQALDLLDKMLRIQPKDRISAAEILNHPYIVGQPMMEEKVEVETPVTVEGRNRRRQKDY